CRHCGSTECAPPPHSQTRFRCLGRRSGWCSLGLYQQALAGGVGRFAEALLLVDKIGNELHTIVLAVTSQEEWLQEIVPKTGAAEAIDSAVRRGAQAGQARRGQRIGLVRAVVDEQLAARLHLGRHRKR
nr:hypothetical protein [Tanacetum cinerariifolium]